MSDQPKLGKLADGWVGRDAVHVAIIPVEAGQRLEPGDRVSVEHGLALRRGDAVGIVDPFLSRTVEQGQKFWLCLLPGTVTGMRHAWHHPSFESETAEEDMAIIERCAQVCGVTTVNLLDIALAHSEDDDYYFPDDEQRYDNFRDWPAFWSAWSRMTGRRAPDYAVAPFTCSC